MSNLDTILMLHWFFVSHNFSSVLVEPITEFIKGEETLVYFMIGTNFYPLWEVLSHSALHRISYFVLRQSALRCHSVNMAELWGLVPVFCLGPLDFMQFQVELPDTSVTAFVLLPSVFRTPSEGSNKEGTTNPCSAIPFCLPIMNYLRYLLFMNFRPFWMTTPL